MKFVRNSGCRDIDDECQEYPDACKSNEECKKTPGSFICECKLGFQRDDLTQTCVDINECQLLENCCSATQKCENTLGSYNCVIYLPCLPGYTLNVATEICEDDDECSLGTYDCCDGYHCRNTPGSYRCDSNYRVTSGKRIVIVTSEIVPKTPMTPAVQSDPRRCLHGFEPGENGQCLDVDECQRFPNACARSRQKCVNTVGSFRYFFLIFYGLS